MKFDKTAPARLVLLLLCLSIPFQAYRALRWYHPLAQGQVQIEHTVDQQALFTGRISSRSQGANQSAPSKQGTNPDTTPTEQKVNLNTATEAELETLPGIGPKKAQAILEYRETHGFFSSYEALLDVDGIGPATLERLKPYLTLE